MALFSEAGWLFLLRWIHFLSGIIWIGLLYYFNFVQTPFFAETEAPVRSGAIQKLVPRALWWFRYGALFTSYASCPRCNAKTVTRTTSTLEAPTTVSEGRLQVDELCAHCSYADRQVHTIPREHRSSDSSSTSSSSRSSGGSSSGRGSSGSW